MKSYKEWVHWLESRNIMPQVRPGLKHTEAAFRESGLFEFINPAKVIHIAGTNGKGTTAKTLEQLLLGQGKTVGLYTSPHLQETTERIRICGKMISQDMFSKLCEEYHFIIEKHNLSHFESLTLFSAHLFFKTENVDYAIYEIGLGGTWDATNVIPHSTSVITTLGFDHTHILGNTLAEIADNKFGIIQENNRVYHLRYDKEILELLQKKLQATQSTAMLIEKPATKITTNTQPPSLPQYSLSIDNMSYPLSLPGLRAAENMWLAFHVYLGLGFSISSGGPLLNSIDWPARMTPLQISSSCPIYLSGDHNIQGLESLKEILLQSRYQTLYFVFGLSKNRVHKDFIQLLKTIPRSVILLTKPNFGGVIPDNQDYKYFDQPMDALNFARSRASAEDMIVVTGSLYLCGEIMNQVAKGEII